MVCPARLFVLNWLPEAPIKMHQLILQYTLKQRSGTLVQSGIYTLLKLYRATLLALKLFLEIICPLPVIGLNRLGEYSIFLFTLKYFN